MGFLLALFCLSWHLWGASRPAFLSHWSELSVKLSTPSLEAVWTQNGLGNCSHCLSISNGINLEPSTIAITLSLETSKIQCLEALFFHRLSVGPTGYQPEHWKSEVGLTKLNFSLDLLCKYPLTLVWPPAHPKAGKTGTSSVLFCLWLLQILLERAWPPGSPLREAPSKMKVQRGERKGKETSIFGP